MSLNLKRRLVIVYRLCPILISETRLQGQEYVVGSSEEDFNMLSDQVVSGLYIIMRQEAQPENNLAKTEG